MKIHVETERLILREVVPTDDESFFELDSDPEVHQYLGNNPITSIEQARDIIQMIRQQYVDNGIGRWAVVEKKTNQFIGWSGLKFFQEPINNHVHVYDLGYRLMKKYWGKGFATESAIASRDYAFDTLKLDSIYAMADVNNAASNHVLKKIGFGHVEEFEFQGIVHNWYEMKIGNRPPTGV